MKRVIRILISILLIVSLFTACTKPIDTYKEAVDEAGIEELIAELELNLDSLNEAAVVFDESVLDTNAASEEAFLSALGLVDLIGTSNDVLNSIESIEEAVNDMDVSLLEDEAVATLHSDLTDSLDEYTEMVSILSESTDATIAMMAPTYNMMAKGNELGNIIMSNYTSLSETFLNAFLENQTLLEGAMMVLADDSFMEMLETGDVDTVLINDTLANVEAVGALMGSYEAENDSDKAVKAFLVELIDSVTLTLTSIVEYGPVVKKTASYDSMQQFIDTYRNENKDKLNNYLEGVQQSFKEWSI